MAIDKIRNKNGVAYRTRIVLSNGQRKSRCFNRKVDAETWEAKVRVEGKEFSRLQRKRVRFSELATMFIDNYGKPMMALSSSQKYIATLRIYLVPTFGNLWIDEITKLQIVEFRATVEEFSVSASTKHFIFTALKTIMRKALEWDLIDRNPSDGVKAPRKGMGRLEYWKASEVSRFLDSNRNNPHLPLFLIALNTGMRIGEIMGLKWQNVDLENGLITIQEIYDQKLNAVKATTKSRRVRQIGINGVLSSVFVALAHNRKSDFVLEGKNYRSRAYHFSKLLKKACEAASVRPLKFHDLRHTFATGFVTNGGSIHALSGILGHTTSTMTAKYAHFGPEHAIEAARVVSFNVPETANVLHFGQERKQNSNRSGQDLVINH